MALSSFIGRVSPPLLKGRVFGCLSKKLIIPSCCVDFRQPYHLQSCENTIKFSPFESNRRSVSTLNVCQRFSTSASLSAQHKGHDHTKLWTFERGLAVVLMSLTPAAFIYPSQPLDTALALTIILHTHFGLEAIVVDYIRPIIFGEIIPKISMGLLYLFSIVTLAGLLNLIYNDMGLANTIISVWKM